MHLPRRRLTICALSAACALLAAAIPASSASADAAPPEVTGVSPNDGPPAGGTSVAINGANFSAATAVKFVGEFGEETDAASFTVNSDASITAVSPPGHGVADILVVGPGGTSPRAAEDRFGYGPILDQMTPQHGPAAGGTSVTLSGFGLQGASEVNFGATPAASFSENPDGSITAVSPPLTADETVIRVTVTTPQGTSATNDVPDTWPANQFAYGPAVTEVRPSSGPMLGGSSVTIRGAGFKSPVFRCFCGPFVHAVYFGPTGSECGSPRDAFVPCAPVEFVVNSDTEITALAPPGAGTVDVQVETDGGTSPITSADRFSYEPAAPSIESESASQIAATDATLEAKINPNGLDTSYHFEIAKSPACLPVKAPYTPCAHVHAGNLPQGAIPAGSEGQPVSLDLASAGISLEPGATYDYRVVASNSGGESEGQAQTFKTPPASSTQPEAKILSRQALLDGHPWVKLVVSCKGERGSVCSGSIGLTGVPRSIGAGRVRRFSGWRKFTLPAGSERPITIDLLPYVIPLLEEVHQLRLRAVITPPHGEKVAKQIVLRSRPVPRGSILHSRD